MNDEIVSQPVSPYPTPPFACVSTLLPIAGVVYSITGAVQTSQGQDFRYWLGGDWLRGTLVH